MVKLDADPEVAFGDSQGRRKNGVESCNVGSRRSASLPRDQGSHAIDKLIQRNAHIGSTSSLLEVKRLAPDIDYAASLKEEIGTNKSAELVCEVVGTFW
jgi:hypothetical protein